MNEGINTYSNATPFTAVVQDIILDELHPMYIRKGGPLSIGLIFFKEIDTLGENTPLDINKIFELPNAKPLFSFLRSYPLKNEVVYLIPSFPSNTNSISQPEWYYLPDLSTWGHSHHNAYLLDVYRNKMANYHDAQDGLPGQTPFGSTPDVNTNLGLYFKERGIIKPLRAYEGDRIIEGRNGNSIRFGMTTTLNPDIISTANNWSSDGEKESTIGDPITIIRNGQSEIENDEFSFYHITEDINNDASSIYLTSNQRINNFVPASIHNKSFGANLEIFQTVEAALAESDHSLVTPLRKGQKEPNITPNYSEIENQPVMWSPKNVEGLKEEEELPPIVREDMSLIVEEKTDSFYVKKSNVLVNYSAITQLTLDDISTLTNHNLEQRIGRHFLLKQLLMYDINNYPKVVKIKDPTSDIEKNITGKIKKYTSTNAHYGSRKRFEAIIRGCNKITIDLPEEVPEADPGNASDAATVHTVPISRSNKLIFVKSPEYTDKLSRDDNTGEMYPDPLCIENLLLDITSKVDEIYSKNYEFEYRKEKIVNYPGIDKNLISGAVIISNLNKLFYNCVDRIYNKYNNMEICSAYRSSELNKKLGGSNSNSDHLYGYAVDFKVPGEATADIFNWCKDMLPIWKDLMWAYPERGEESWIHLSYKEGENKRNLTLASEREDIHESYGGLTRGLGRSIYQDNIIEAKQDLV